MQIKLAKTAGFCMGVKRAMDIVSEASKNEKGKIFTYGPLIHNPQVIKMLETRNIRVIHEPSEIDSGTLVIRTHGITPNLRKKFSEKKISINDATCPLVMKVQGYIKKYARLGYFIIIVGDEGHAEVTALMGFAGEQARVINSLQDVDKLPLSDKVCVVAQTTLNTHFYKEITRLLKIKYPEIIIAQTICEATEERQSEVLELARKVEAMVIVGGKNSANSTRLADIAKSVGTPTYFIETEDELKLEDFRKYNTVGISAGASTPNWMIDRVINKLSNLQNKKPNFFSNILLVLSQIFLMSNFYTVLGGVAVTYASCKMQNIPPRWSLLIIAALYLFSMRILNDLADKDSIKLLDPQRAEFCKKHKKLLITLGIFAILTSSTLASLRLGIFPLIIFIFANFLGLIYSIRFFGKFRLKDIPGSKDIFVGLAWLLVTVFIPFFSSGNDKDISATIVISIFVFSMIYIRSVLLDIKDIHGDKFLGRETLPILIGKEKTKFILLIISSLVGLLLFLSPIYRWTSDISYYLLPTILYTWGYLFLYHKRLIGKGLTCEWVVDGKFILIGLLSHLHVG